MTAFHLHSARFRAWDQATGAPLAGGKVYLYEKGTTTPKTTWADVDKAAANTHPVILDANGQAAVYIEGAYKVRIDDANDVTLLTEDGLASPFDASDAQALIDAAIASVLPTYDTVSALSLATVDSGVERVRVLGYQDVHDAGGAEYIRVSSAPSHSLRVRSQDRFLPGGATDSLNGGWWEIALEGYSPLVIGAIGDAVTNDAAAIDAVNDPNAPSKYIDLLGRTYEYVGTFTPDASKVFAYGRIVDDAQTHDFFPIEDVTDDGNGIVTVTSPTANTRQVNLTAAAILTALGLPANPNDGNEYLLQELDDVLSWVLKSAVGGSGGIAAADVKPFAEVSVTLGDPSSGAFPNVDRQTLYTFVDLIWTAQGTASGGGQGAGTAGGVVQKINQTTGVLEEPTFPFTIPAGSWYYRVVTDYSMFSTASQK